MRRLTTLLSKGYVRIAVPLGKIEFKMWYFFKCLNFIILINNLFLCTKLHAFWYEVQKIKEIYKIKRSSKLGGHDHMERFQTSTHLEGYLGRLFPVHVIWAFRVMVVVWCKKPEQRDSWFNYHIHRWIHSVCFACKTIGMLLLYENGCIIWQILTNSRFL